MSRPDELLLGAIDWSVALYVCEDLLPAVSWQVREGEGLKAVEGTHNGNEFLVWARVHDGEVVWDAKFARSKSGVTVILHATQRPSTRLAVKRIKTMQESTRKKIRDSFKKYRRVCQDTECAQPAHARDRCKRHYNEWVRERRRLGLPPLSGRKIAGWSRDYVKCIDVDCSTPELPHKAGGRCTRCWMRNYQRKRRAEARSQENSDG